MIDIFIAFLFIHWNYLYSCWKLSNTLNSFLQILCCLNCSLGWSRSSRPSRTSWTSRSSWPQGTPRRHREGWSQGSSRATSECFLLHRVLLENVHWGKVQQTHHNLQHAQLHISKMFLLPTSCLYPSNWLILLLFSTKHNSFNGSLILSDGQCVNLYTFWER